ncbi:predicted protein [Uncinocarpus reesii 1704]|uniref:Uncharacterized protein n=1 Tax=Uncinocarpus reesii (strain UAMH 1704) TaxID=336963 RepID=C4JVM3_UNCRE|nr:uncharacterized protein UREG_06615 [Uncinocarpus reesii 1704]EEP81750.1 predicted protein [Uncinocarpus reesii 1704]
MKDQSADGIGSGAADSTSRNSKDSRAHGYFDLVTTVPIDCSAPCRPHWLQRRAWLRQSIPGRGWLLAVSRSSPRTDAGPSLRLTKTFFLGRGPLCLQETTTFASHIRPASVGSLQVE